MAKANRANGSRGFPKEIKLPNGAAIALRLMEHGDKDQILTFARSLPQDDLLFLRTDITEPASVEEWIRNVESGDTATVLAEAEQLCLHVDKRSGRVAPAEPAVLSRIAKVGTAHSHLPRPERAGRRIGDPRA